MSWSDHAGCGCKINLRLKVTSRREDGLHELSTLFYPLDFPGDELSVREADGLTLEVPEAPELAGSGNLVYRAAQAYAERAGIAPAWHFTLHKNSPVAAGLGGGSADAAAALRLLNGHYRVFSADELAETALTLGADVPFFLTRRPAWATGVGEKLRSINGAVSLPEVLIIYPGFPVSAKWAYTHLSPELIGAEDIDVEEAFAGAFAGGKNVPWQQLCRNDLGVALFEKFPLLRLIKAELESCGAAAVQVSGSGSSLFALFHENSAGAAQRVREKFGNYRGLRIFTGGKEW